jgi:hypothetical protein
MNYFSTCGYLAKDLDRNLFLFLITATNRMQFVILFSLLNTISAIALPGGIVSKILDGVEHGGFASPVK